MVGFDYTLVQKWFGRARFQLLDLMRGTQSAACFSLNYFKTFNTLFGLIL